MPPIWAPQNSPNKQAAHAKLPQLVALGLIIEALAVIKYFSYLVFHISLIFSDKCGNSGFAKTLLTRKRAHVRYPQLVTGLLNDHAHCKHQRQYGY